ncbi:hypothetical protein MJO29_014889 [Puccinia striiformis f. sp. tritici]|nr:hypothetical protein MJO29_014889 [Puccinia striiformis f. sp. tritici]
MNHKYDLPPEHNNPFCAIDPNLTIDEMGEKADLWEKLQSELLPSIRNQITALLTSLDLHDLEKHPSPDLDATLEILSNFDRTLETIVASTVSFALRSPLPDEQHDHRLKNLKSFRSSQLRLKIKSLIHSQIYSLFECCEELLTWCGMSIGVNDASVTRQEASNSRQQIHRLIAHARDSIDNAIEWSRRSGWSIIREDWLWVARSFNEALEDLTELTNPATLSTLDLASLTNNVEEESDFVNITDLQTRRNATREKLVQVAKSTIPLVKLARILVNKALKIIPQKPIFELDTEISSDTIEQLRKAFSPITVNLSTLACHFQDIHRRHEGITIAARDYLRASVVGLSEAMYSLTDLAFHHLPSLHGVKLDSPESDFNTWSLTFKQLWDNTVARSLHLISSFEVEPEEILQQDL